MRVGVTEDKKLYTQLGDTKLKVPLVLDLRMSNLGTEPREVGVCTTMRRRQAPGVPRASAECSPEPRTPWEAECSHGCASGTPPTAMPARPRPEGSPSQGRCWEGVMVGAGPGAVTSVTGRPGPGAGVSALGCWLATHRVYLGEYKGLVLRGDATGGD